MSIKVESKSNVIIASLPQSARVSIIACSVYTGPDALSDLCIIHDTVVSRKKNG